MRRVLSKFCAFFLFAFALCVTTAHSSQIPKYFELSMMVNFGDGIAQPVTAVVQAGKPVLIVSDREESVSNGKLIPAAMSRLNIEVTDVIQQPDGKIVVGVSIAGARLEAGETWIEVLSNRIFTISGERSSATLRKKSKRWFGKRS